MRNILLGVLFCTTLASSLVVLAYGLGFKRPGFDEAVERAVERHLARHMAETRDSEPKRTESSRRPTISEAMGATGDPSSSAPPSGEDPSSKETGLRPMKKPATLSEVVALLSEIEGMILDSEKAIRSDLRTIYEKLGNRIESLQAAAREPEQSEPVAKAAFRSQLKDLGVTVSPDEKMIEMVGEVLEPSRVLELAIVAPGGRAHESLLIVEVTPSALKLGLEDIGLVETEPDVNEGTYPAGAKGAYIYVLWDGIKKPRHLADMILNLRTNTTMERTPWMFTASRMFTDTRTWERHFAADVYKNVVALTWNYCLDAVLANPLEDAKDETIWTPHPDLCPPAGTKVRIFMTTEPRPEWDKI
ncbi:MAG TPA: YdjY domain-containing protein [Planctomycetota bacterium]|nr:YdjY domain-containing protein [Planctomycetota bacterium]